MIRLGLRKFVVFLISICLICTFLMISHVFADKEGGSDSGTKTAAWYNSIYGMDLLRGTSYTGWFGPYSGFGEQGIDVQFQTPFGGYTSYRSTGFGMGLGGTLSGYSGMYSPLAASTYGPYTYGGNTQIQPSPGWNTEGIMAGSLFGPNVSFYTPQPGIMGLFFGMPGGGFYSGFGGLGLFGYGIGGYGGLSGWW